MTIRMSAAEIESYLDEVFPQLHHGGRTYFIEEVGPMTARMRCDYHEKHLRPGGTISGPTMMALADLALYAAILAQIGPVGLAVTTSLSFNFLRKPGQAALIGEAKLLKLGKRLAVGEVRLYSQGETEMVCHATGTYSIPAER
ncbi:PaaI family thioesterase [Bosea sp. RAF48]|uniref:PaaI family thioesterase n=1 Tax=Bosea sp. RAF48 TaxID=3237480 RepID=UPI003F90D37A